MSVLELIENKLRDFSLIGVSYPCNNKSIITINI
jgi:hypothetical protein